MSTLLLEGGPHQNRLAILEEGRLVELYLEKRHQPGSQGNIYKGRVSRVVPGIQAAFVDIGLRRNAFLFLGDASRTDGDGEEEAVATEPAPPPVAGEELLVQVAKEELRGKGARITRDIALPGRYLVLLPGADQVGVSRRIVDDAERERLRELAEEVRQEGTGLIVRTVALGVAREPLAAEYRSLADQWSDIERRAGAMAAPQMVHGEPDLPERVARDLLIADVERVVVEGEAVLDRLTTALGAAAPELESLVEVHSGDELLFDRFDVDRQIDQALGSRVWLESGGCIVVHPTEALVAIDVNTGRFVGQTDLEDTVTRTNLEAVREVVRQIRLRDLSGILVIDFIDMEQSENRLRVFEALEAELARDRARSRVLAISEFGLVQITRERGRTNLRGQLTEPCSRCRASGRVLSPSAVCHRLRQTLIRRHRRLGAAPVRVIAHPSVLEALAGREDAVGQELRELWREDLELVADAALRPDEFTLESTAGRDHELG